VVPLAACSLTPESPSSSIFIGCGAVMALFCGVFAIHRLGIAVFNESKTV
jgi:hypothetical protein